MMTALKRWFKKTPPPLTPTRWLDDHRTELSVGTSPDGSHIRVYDHVTKLPHYGHTLVQAAAAAQHSREHQP